MSRKVIFTLGIGFAGATHKEVFTLNELGITEDEYETEGELEGILEEEWKEWTHNYIDGGFELEE